MKAISKDLESYHIAVDGIEHAFKTPAIVGQYKPNIFAPLVYLLKPKWVSEDDFKRIISSITIELKEVK